MLPHSDAIPARFEVTFTQFPSDGDKRGRSAAGLGRGFVVEEDDSLAANTTERPPPYSVCSSNSEIAQDILQHFAATWTMVTPVRSLRLASISFERLSWCRPWGRGRTHWN